MPTPICVDASINTFRIYWFSPFFMKNLFCLPKFGKSTDIRITVVDLKLSFVALQIMMDLPERIGDEPPFTKACEVK